MRVDEDRAVENGALNNGAGENGVVEDSGTGEVVALRQQFVRLLTPSKVKICDG